MQLGAFSVSLSVKDLEVSRVFYEKLGFAHFAGEPAKDYLIMKNGDTVIGLFQGMFQGNIMTFNPGWDQNAQEQDSYTDIREIEKQLKDQGLAFLQETDGAGTGPASFMLLDPDGNAILVDQHR